MRLDDKNQAFLAHLCLCVIMSLVSCDLYHCIVLASRHQLFREHIQDHLLAAELASASHSIMLGVQLSTTCWYPDGLGRNLLEDEVENMSSEENNIFW